MIWVIAGVIVAVGLFAVIDRLTDAPIQRRRVNIGTDRYQASLDSIRTDRRSIFDIRIGSGELNDPTAKRLPIEAPSSDDQKPSR